MHYELEKHCYAIDIESKATWDFAWEDYVWRIIQNQADNKLVPIENRDISEDRDVIVVNSIQSFNKKINELSEEYQRLMVSMLESQRKEMEKKFEEIKKKRLVEHDLILQNL